MKKFLDKNQLHILEGYGVDADLNENWGVEEILEQLPPFIHDENGICRWYYTMTKSYNSEEGTSYSVCLRTGPVTRGKAITARAPVDAWFKMWVWTLEHAEE